MQQWSHPWQQLLSELAVAPASALVFAFDATPTPDQPYRGSQLVFNHRQHLAYPF